MMSTAVQTRLQTSFRSPPSAVPCTSVRTAYVVLQVAHHIPNNLDPLKAFAQIHNQSGAHPEFFALGGGGGPGPETIYNLRFILKIVIKIML
jgi:hypothetical protein